MRVLTGLEYLVEIKLMIFTLDEGPTLINAGKRKTKPTVDGTPNTESTNHCGSRLNEDNFSLF